MRLFKPHARRSFLLGCATSRREPIPDPQVQEAEGLIHVVDPISRELVLLTKKVPVAFYVPLDCLITLNEERVKLRLLQPMDRATVLFTQEHGRAVARSIVVSWASALSVSAQPETAAQPRVRLMECT
jgi:hypothetical protein